MRDLLFATLCLAIVALVVTLVPRTPHAITTVEVAQLVARAREKFGLPALAVSTLTSAGIDVEIIDGTRVLGQNNPSTIDDFFHIGSCSKSVLALISGRLIEAGKLGWNTRFFEVFPELRGDANPGFHDITLSQLFRGTAGILKYDSEEEIFPEIEPGSENPRLEFIRYLIRQPPASARTRNGEYEQLHSNASFTMVAAMLERLSDQSWEELVRQTLTDDLGIPVHIGWPNELGADQPWGHKITGKGTEAFGPDHPYHLPDLIAPAGDLSLSAAGFSEMIRQHLIGLRGASTYLSQETFHHIHFGHEGLSMAVGNGSIGGHRLSGTNGSAGTFYVQGFLFSNEDFAFTILTNAGSGKMQMPAVDWLTAKILKKRYRWWWKVWL